MVILYSHLRFFWCYDTQISEKMWHFSFWIWAMSLRIFSRFNHLSASFISFFFIAGWNSIVCMHHIFMMHSSAEGHLHCFHLPAVLNSSNEHAWASRVGLKSFGNLPKNGRFFFSAFWEFSTPISREAAPVCSYISSNDLLPQSLTI